MELERKKDLEFQPLERYLVPDLTPKDRVELGALKPRWVFVAESPHVSEIESDSLSNRRPLCGVAGRQWWGLLSELLEGKENSDVSRNHLIEFCLRNGVCVLNAVQYPLDPKVTRLFPQADPVKNLGFNKVAGAYSYKKLKRTACVQAALGSLHERLNHPSLSHLPVHCLGNDAQWFVEQVLDSARVAEKIPHPSAWWRQNGLFGRIAREKLSQILGEL